MKILLTGGGSGGHFYPLIAIAEELQKQAQESKQELELYYMSDKSYNQELLDQHNITFKKNTTGKIRIYFSLQNILDFFKTCWGVVMSIWKVFILYPDVVIGKGGYASFPALLAARIFFIPVIIHESDAVPGRVNHWAGKFAKRVALSYEEASVFFPEDKVAYTGQPIQKSFFEKSTTEDQREECNRFTLEETVPTIAVLGGSLGARTVNDAIIEALPTLVENYTILHQTGKDNLKDVRQKTDYLLKDSPYKKRYQSFPYLNSADMRCLYYRSDLIISRAGSTIFEIALSHTPSILIPITHSQGNHQRKNAFSYARTGAAKVIEEGTLSKIILERQIQSIFEDKELYKKMEKGSSNFIHPEAAEKIAKESLYLASSHM